MAAFVSGSGPVGSPTRSKELRSSTLLRFNGNPFQTQGRDGASLSIEMPENVSSNELQSRTGPGSSNTNVTGASMPATAGPTGRIGDLRLRGSGGMVLNDDQYTSGLIKPFNKPHLSMVSAFARELRVIAMDPRARRFLPREMLTLEICQEFKFLDESKKIFVLGIFNLLCTVVLLMCCSTTESIALTAYTYLTIFDLFMLLTCLLSVWIEEQSSTSKFTFGYSGPAPSFLKVFWLPLSVMLWESAASFLSVLLLWESTVNRWPLFTICRRWFRWLGLFILFGCRGYRAACHHKFYGYERFEVLAVFASTIMAHLGSFFIIKESIERIMLLPDIHISRFPLGAIVAFVCHMVVTYGTNNKSWNHVVSAASSSWLQEHVADVSQSVCHAVPGLSTLLLPRANPLVLIAFAGGIALFLTHLLVEMNNYRMADPIAAISIAMMTCGTMFPMSVYSGKILLQTTPSHIVGQLDKCLREASTLDGVLEFRNEHFWTLSFGMMAGSLHVRVRRDANEQLVLAHLVDRLSNLVKVLTIQVFKDDWTRSTTTFQLLNDTARLTGSASGQKLPNSSPDASSLPRLPTPAVNNADNSVHRPVTTSHSSYIKQSMTHESYASSNQTKSAVTDVGHHSYLSPKFSVHPASSSSTTFIPTPNTFTR